MLQQSLTVSVNNSSMSSLRVPDAPKSIQKGASLKDVLGLEAVDCLAHNLSLVYPRFDAGSFRRAALAGLEPLGLMERGPHLANALHQCLPSKYSEAIGILLASLTPPLTQRFSAEFSIRPFLIQQQDRTLSQLIAWTTDPNPHVRRLCTEGTRPRLPWGRRIPAFIANPEPLFPILESLKDDECLYVRRSVANHLGDIAKDHPEKVFALCERWLEDATPERKWLIRHAVLPCGTRQK